MRISEKRKVGEILGRAGISIRIIKLATEIADGTYKEAIEKAAQISLLVEAASFDDYWNEKASIGRNRETAIFEDLISGNLSTDAAISPISTKLIRSLK